MTNENPWPSDEEEDVSGKYLPGKKAREAVVEDQDDGEVTRPIVEVEHQKLTTALRVPIEKRRTVLEYVALGMEVEGAYYAAALDLDEMEALESDSVFAFQCKRAQYSMEAVRLASVEAVRLRNERIGETRETRWLLEKTNPGRWGNKVQTVSANPTIPLPIIEERTE